MVPAAVGGDLSAESLLQGFTEGRFPMPTDDIEQAAVNEILYELGVLDGYIRDLGGVPANKYRIVWWSPNPRHVIPVGRARIGRRARQIIQDSPWETTVDTAFADVVRCCRKDRHPEWITDHLEQALVTLHRRGWAHSVEVWHDGELIGGVFGLGQGQVMSLDSAFHTRTGASLAAVLDSVHRLINIVEIVDVQMPGPLAARVGAIDVDRAVYMGCLSSASTPVAMPSDRRPADWFLG